ncbi:hypothetical protein HOY82DRAFT_594477 [Tuber indicum]|nr:hypothetical protein HOY82DRAFT_594477 [Tuber indicum]
MPNFNRGRKTQFVIVCCLYIVCHPENSSHMPIDFSDIPNTSFPLEVDGLLSANSAPGECLLTRPHPSSTRSNPCSPVTKHRSFGLYPPLRKVLYLDSGNKQTKVAKDALGIIQHGLAIPVLPVPLPLPISSLPETPIGLADPLTLKCAENSQSDQWSAIAGEEIKSALVSLLDGSAASIMEQPQGVDPHVSNEYTASTTSDGPDNLNDFEVQNALLTEEECNLKGKIPLEINKYYLCEQ